MKRLLRVSILSLLCTLCALVPTLAARADSVALLGERAYTDYDLGNACPTATVGSALDWLEDLLDDEVGYISEAATDLLELVAIGEGLSDVTPEIATFAESRVMKASEIRSEVQFFYDRLINANVQIPVLEEQIRSGEFDQATIDEMKADLDELTHETQKLLDSLPTKSSTWTSALQSEQKLFWSNGSASPWETPSANVTALRTAVETKLHQQAEALMQAETGKAPVVRVISDKEIGFSVKTKMGLNGKAIEKVKITLVSLDDKGKEITRQEKLTDQYGTAVFWIADFKPNKKGNVNLEIIYDGSTATAASGKHYRVREFGRKTMSGGDTFEMVLAEENGEPYLIRATYDNHDMLNIVNGVFLSSQNDLNHKVDLKMQTQGKPQHLRAWYWTGYTTWAALFEQDFVPSGGNNVVSQSVERQFARKGAPGAFPENKQIYFELKTKSGSDAVEGPSVGDKYEKDKIAFGGEKAKTDAPQSGKQSKGDSSLIGGYKLAIPKVVPVIGGMTVTIPLQTGFTWYMEVGVAFRFGYNREVSPPDNQPGAWKNDTLIEQQERVKAIKESDAGCIQKMLNGIKSDYMAMSKEKYLASSVCSITPYIFLNLEYNFKTDHGQGGISFGVILTYKFTFTRQFMIAIVPAFITFEFSTTFQFGLAFGAQGDLQNNGSVKNLKMSSDFGLNLLFRIGISLTVGAGLPRFAYLGLQGCAWIELGAVIGAMNFTYDLGVSVNAVVKFLCFDKSWVLWQKVLTNKKTAGPGLQTSFLIASLGTGLTEENSGYYTETSETLSEGDVNWEEVPYDNLSVEEKERFADLGAIAGTMRIFNNYHNSQDPLDPKKWTLIDIQIVFYLKTIQEKGKDVQRLFCAHFLNDTKYGPEEILFYDRNDISRIRADDNTGAPRQVYDFDVTPLTMGDDLNNATRQEYFIVATTTTEDIKLSEGANAEKENYKKIYNAQNKNVKILVSRLSFDVLGSKYMVQSLKTQERGAKWEYEPITSGQSEAIGLLSPRICVYHYQQKYDPAEVLVSWVAYSGPQSGELGDDSWYRIAVGSLKPNSEAGTKFYGAFYPKYKVKEYHTPDVHFIPALYKGTPAFVALTQSKLNPLKSELYLNVGNGKEGITINDIAFSTMSNCVKLSANETAKTASYLFGMLKKNPNAQTNVAGDISSELCILKVDVTYDGNLNSGVVSDPKNIKFSLSSVGVNVSADGVNIMRILAKDRQYWTLYAYWVEAIKETAKDQKKVDAYIVRACMLGNTPNGTVIASKPFTWFRLGKGYGDGIARKMQDFHISDREFSKYPAVGLCKFIKPVGKARQFGVGELRSDFGMSAAIRAFATEHAIVTQGRDFGMLFRLENTGMLPLKSIDVDVVANKLDAQGKPTKEEVQLKGIHIDTTNPTKNSVVNYDFDHDPVVTGESAVYRMPDINDAYNNGRVTITNYDYLFAGTAGTPTAQTEYIKCLIPGDIATFKTTVTNSPKTWKGMYALKAEVVKCVTSYYIPTKSDINGGGEVEFFGMRKDADGNCTYHKVTVADDGTETWDDTPIVEDDKLPFVYYAPAAVVADAESMGIDEGNFTTNTVLNESLLTANNNGENRGDERYADIEYNDFELDMDTILCDGEYYALVNLSNDTYPGAPTKIPSLLVGSEFGSQTEDELTGKAYTLGTTLDGGFSRTLVIPVADLVNPATPYEEVTLTAVNSAQSARTQKAEIVYGGKAGYYEVNPYNNTDNLLIRADFVFAEQPQDVTVGVGGPATFRVGMGGPEGLTYSYQWYATLPDHTVMTLPGQTAATLSLSGVTTSHNGMRYWCVVTAKDKDGKIVGVSLMSDAAQLTVPSSPWEGDALPAGPLPPTGDRFPLFFLLCAATVSFLGLVVLGARKRKRRG